MPYRFIPFTNQTFYHVFNRGVEKREIFSNQVDYQRFLNTLYYYQFQGPKPRFSTYKMFRNQDFLKNPKIVELVCFCLMPNHFHLLIKQNNDRGIEEFMSKLLNSYARYYNTKYRRVGPLFQGQFKAVLVESDEQLMHLSRYIHLNPYVSGLADDLLDYPYSSYKDYIGLSTGTYCSTEHILNFFKDQSHYKEFVSDHQSYALELELIKHQLIDED